MRQTASTEIKFINAHVDVALRNSDFGRDDPVYSIYDENWVDIGRCHNFSGVDCELVFEEAFEQTFAKAARPKQVYIKVYGSVELDPALDGWADPLYVLVPSRRGMVSEPRQPIWCNGISAHTRVRLIGPYVGRYSPVAADTFWMECNEIEAFNE